MERYTRELKKHADDLEKRLEITQKWMETFQSSCATWHMKVLELRQLLIKCEEYLSHDADPQDGGSTEGQLLRNEINKVISTIKLDD